MIKNLIDEVMLLNDFGISQVERITREERMKRMQAFRKDVSINKYRDLFNKIQESLLDDNESLEDKDILINAFIEFIRNFTILEENVKDLPTLLFNIYNSHMNLVRLNVLLEILSSYDTISVLSFEKLLLEYLEFLDDESNEFYIHNCYSRVERLNNNIDNYLNKKDIDGTLAIHLLNDSEPLNLFNQKTNDLKQKRLSV